MLEASINLFSKSTEFVTVEELECVKVSAGSSQPWFTHHLLADPGIPGTLRLWRRVHVSAGRFRIVVVFLTIGRDY